MESDEYRNGAIKVETEKQELSRQFRELQGSVNTTLREANKPKSPRQVRHALTPRPVKTAVGTRHKFYSPQLNHNKKYGFATQYDQSLNDFTAQNNQNEEPQQQKRPTTTTRKIVFTFPDKLEDI